MFLPTEEQQMLIESLRRYLDEKLEPEIRSHGEGSIPRDQMQVWVKALSQFGIASGPISEKWGGMGSDWMTHLMLIEELGYSSLDVGIPCIINAIGSKMLEELAPEEMKARYLPSLATGDAFIAVAISEPDVGSDVAAIKTTARRDGDNWVINGEKTWISNGEYADVVLCTCRDDTGGITHIAVDRDDHGFEVRGINKMALNGQSTAQVFFNDCRVPVSNTVGSVGAGLVQTLKIFEYARCHMAMWGISIARRAKDEAIRYARERVQHGKPIAGHQLVAAKIATMATKIDAARLLTMRAMSLVEAGRRAEVECAMAKWYGTEIAVQATRDAVQIHGGNGVTKEFIVERLAREAIIGPIPDGTTEIQKLLIARSLTGINPF